MLYYTSRFLFKNFPIYEIVNRTLRLLQTGYFTIHRVTCRFLEIELNVGLFEIELELGYFVNFPVYGPTYRFVPVPNRELFICLVFGVVRGDFTMNFIVYLVEYPIYSLPG